MSKNKRKAPVEKSGAWWIIKWALVVGALIVGFIIGLAG